jgi:phosphatidylserine decarboxylase
VNRRPAADRTPQASARDSLVFVLTNPVPRALLTRWVGWFSRIRSPLLCRASLAVWRQFEDIDLGDAKKKRFDSLHEVFTRELAAGARPFHPDPAVLASPCDAIVGACGRIDGAQVLQAKGRTYDLRELLIDAELAERFRGGCYATLRLTPGMYHRFHAPHDCTVEQVTYVSGDVWNVNPATLARIERVFCKNERAVIRARLHRGKHAVALVPVAAILVASIRLHFLDVLLHLKYRGPHRLACDATLAKGDEMGWFEHGSTMIVLAPAGFELCEGIAPGTRVRAGNALMRMPAHRGA